MFFGPNCSVAERPGCRKAGPPGDDLHGAGGDAERGEQRERVALGVEDVDGAAARSNAVPAPLRLARPRRNAAAAMR